MIDKSFIKQCLIPLNHKDTLLHGANLSDLDTETDKKEQELLIEYLKATGIETSSEFRQASVLLPLMWNKDKNEWDLLLTKRAVHLKHHPGEISFPGGRFEQPDINLQQTAKRETQEEVGIDTSHIDIIGKLPKQNTISQYQVTPFIGIVNSGYKITIDTNEVEEAFLVPLSFVIDTNNHEIVTQEINQKSFSFTVIQYQQYRIWGATARMIVNFGRRLKR